MAIVNVTLADTFDQWRVKTNSIGTQTGDLTTLSTTHKASVVGAINEIFKGFALSAQITTYDTETSYLQSSDAETLTLQGGANTYRKALFTHANYRMGLTATLERSDEEVQNVLLPYFKGISFNYNFERAKKDKVIAPYGVACIGVNLSYEEQNKYDSSGKKMEDAKNLLIINHEYPQNI